MMRYALLYERLSLETRAPETVVAHYAEGTRTAERHEYIQASIMDAKRVMIEQDWRYHKTAGPQSILMQHE